MSQNGYGHTHTHTHTHTNTLLPERRVGSVRFGGICGRGHVDRTAPASKAPVTPGPGTAAGWARGSGRHRDDAIIELLEHEYGSRSLHEGVCRDSVGRPRSYGSNGVNHELVQIGCISVRRNISTAKALYTHRGISSFMHCSLRLLVRPSRDRNQAIQAHIEPSHI